MRKIFFTLLCILPVALLAQNAPNILPNKNTITDTSEQFDLLDFGKILFHIKPHKIQKQSSKKIYFSLIPIGNNAPEGSGNALVTSTTAGIYLGNKHTTNLSSATFAPYWNLASRFGLPLRSNIWLANNKWNIQGDIRFLIYPQYTWGLGNLQDNNNSILLSYNYTRFYQSALKQITTYFFLGAGYNLDYHASINSTDTTISLKQFTGYLYGTGKNSVSSGISINLLYDTRNNSINPLPSIYANLIYRINPIFLGSNNNWESLYLDLRKYISLNPGKPNQQNNLAFWSYFWTVFNGNAPYLDLPSIGWDSYNRSGRGIDQNRYRGKSLFYLESEYRRDITDNGFLGFVVFSNVNTLSGSGTQFISWHPAGGGGLRIKFNKGSGTNICVDYGFSYKFSQIILNLGEVF